MATLTLQGLISSSDSVTISFLTSTYPAIANAISPALYFAGVLYWVLLGYKVYAGHAPLEWRDLLAKILMTCAVFGSLSWNGFAFVIYNIFVSFMDSASATFMAGQSTTGMLDALFVNANKVSEVLRNAGFYQISAIMEGMVILIINCLLFIIALVYMTIAKFGLAITMVLLPLFIGFSMFRETRQWFMNWVSMMLNFTFIYILVTAIVRFGFLAFGEYIAEVGKAASYADATLITGTQLAYLYIIEGVLVLFMLQVKSWAAMLSGGATVQGVSVIAQAARMLRGGR